MAQSGDAFRKQHDINEVDEPKKDPTLTPEDQDDEFVEGGEKTTDIDKLHNEAYGDEGRKPIDKEIDEDEIARVKDLEDNQTSE